MSLLGFDCLAGGAGCCAATGSAGEGVDLAIDAGEIVGCGGESGSGKGVTALALMGLVDFPGRVRARRMHFAGHDLMSLSERERRRVISRDVAMIF